ncbi:hypothetical protein FTW19_05520 [Terriglobus albidus]|uniref:Uncharacterized protein n=1 Tax=Terriglobus albidus TaxID=1592106 RepID=A0A5B9ELC2_9BACT|nr:hypothetical protein FTW19_05520 [Terriglobus albidus]
MISLGLLFALPLAAAAQQSSSSSSSSQAPSDSTSQQPAQTGPLRLGGVERAGSGIQLEPSESLFDIGAALNACGYDADLTNSSPVRQKVRDDLNAALQDSAEARDARDKVCAYISAHNLGDSTRNLSQFVSLGIYLNPPPDLTPITDLTELPPDAAQVVEILPLLRTFAETTQLHLIWVRNRPEYEEFIARIHDPLTKAILDSNIYLHQPVSSYDGRRFLVFMEPMFAPAAVNARVYGLDYVVVFSPTQGAEVRLDDVRHMYLHYLVEPMIYARPQSIDRLTPLLKTVQDAPLEFIYKNDMVALTTECMIKAIEARVMDVGFPKPKKPSQVKQRSDMEKYEADLADYERRAEVVRQRLVDRDMRLGYVLTDYLYGKLAQLEHTNEALKDSIGEIVYGMDVQHQVSVAKNIQFYPEGTREFVGRTPVRQPKGLDLAEIKLMKGDRAGADEMAQKALAVNPNNPQAHYLKARIAVLDADPDSALDEFNQVLKLSKDPRTLAWTHIYLGRMYDTQREPDRPRAISEYKAALAVRDARPDTKLAAEAGLKKPFAAPKREHSTSDEEDNEPIDPTGKKEKEAYRPK